MVRFLFVILFVLPTPFFQIVRDCGCIKLETVEEGPCIVPPVDLQLDFFKVVNTPEFYYPIISKYALYKYVTFFSGIPLENISEEMAHNACQTYQVNAEAGVSISAFGGVKRSSLDVLITDPGVVDWVQKVPDGSMGYRGRTYITLTDNDKYFVTVSCWETENQKSYSIVSRDKTLNEDSKLTIRNHLKSLGFDLEKSWIELKYDNCYDLSTSKSSAFNATKNETKNSFSSSQSLETGQQQSNFTKTPKQISDSNGTEKSILSVIYNANNNSKFVSSLPPETQKHIETLGSVTSNGQTPQNVIIIYNGNPSSTTSPPTKSTEYRNSADLLFDMFRAGIDFLQNVYRNGIRYLFILAQRVIGRFNSFRQGYST